MKRKFGLLHHAVLISCRLASSKKKANHFIFEKFKSSSSVPLHSKKKLAIEATIEVAQCNNVSH